MWHSRGPSIHRRGHDRDGPREVAGLAQSIDDGIEQRAIVVALRDALEIFFEGRSQPEVFHALRYLRGLTIRSNTARVEPVNTSPFPASSSAMALRVSLFGILTSNGTPS